MKLYIDFGGTNFRYKFENDEQMFKLSSKDINLIEFLNDIVKQNPNINQINVSFAGIVNNGKIISSANTNMGNFDLKKYCKDNFNIDLNIQNDLKCAALAEHNYLKTPSLGVFYIGTGFGAAFFDNNKLILGANNQSSEIGHIPFKKTPFKCGCGREDCIELCVSGSGIQKWCEYYNIPKEYRRLDKLEALDTKEAKIIIDNFYEGLSRAFHTALTLFDFNNLVLGGSVGKNKQIQEYLLKQLEQSAFSKKDLNIYISNLEEGSLEGTYFL